MDAMAAGGSPASGDQQQGALQQGMADLKTFKDAADALGQKYPALASEMGKIRQSIKNMATKLAQQGSQQTASSDAVPSGGGQ